ncbi:MAG: recombinase family protein [Chloroflexota bacterium]
MLVGYARVSTADQKLDLQLDALRAGGCKRLQTDVASGASTARPGLDEACRSLRPGDTLMVWKLDRLGRSLPHLIETIKGLDERGIGFRSLHEHLDTATPGGKLIFPIFGAEASPRHGVHIPAAMLADEMAVGESPAVVSPLVAGSTGRRKWGSGRPPL